MDKEFNIRRFVKNPDRGSLIINPGTASHSEMTGFLGMLSRLIEKAHKKKGGFQEISEAKFKWNWH